MWKITDNLYISSRLGATSELGDISGYFAEDRATHILAVRTPTDEQLKAMEESPHVNYLVHHVEDSPDTDWERVWNDKGIQDFFDSFVKAEKEAETKKQPKPRLIIACRHAAQRSPFFMCCFLISRRDFVPDVAMRLIDKQRRSPFDNQKQVVTWYNSAHPLLQSLGGQGNKFPTGFLRDEFHNRLYKGGYSWKCVDLEYKPPSDPTEEEKQAGQDVEACDVQLEAS